MNGARYGWREKEVVEKEARYQQYLDGRSTTNLPIPSKVRRGKKTSWYVLSVGVGRSSKLLLSGRYIKCIDVSGSPDFVWGLSISAVVLTFPLTDQLVIPSSITCRGRLATVWSSPIEIEASLSKVKSGEGAIGLRGLTVTIDIEHHRIEKDVERNVEKEKRQTSVSNR
jgi:hypothetical protein